MRVQEIWKFIHPRVSHSTRALPSGNMILLGEWMFIFPSPACNTCIILMQEPNITFIISFLSNIVIYWSSIYYSLWLNLNTEEETKWQGALHRYISFIVPLQVSSLHFWIYQHKTSKKLYIIIICVGDVFEEIYIIVSYWILLLNTLKISWIFLIFLFVYFWLPFTFKYHTF